MRMNISINLLLVFVIAVLAVEEKHLIKTSPTDAGKWMTVEEIDKLTLARESFMDVTYTKTLEQGKVAETSKVHPELRMQKIVAPMIAKVSEKRLNATIIHLGTYFNRYYTTETGEQASKWIAKYYKDIIDSIKDKDRKARLSVELFEHRWRQPSVIVRFTGKSAAVKDQLVILGSHCDSTAGGATRRSPGADDDASGTASVMEAFRVMIKDKNWDPSRTVEWHHYAAEEVGLLGSQAIAQKYKQDNKKVHGMLQMDMTGFDSAANGGRVGVVTDFTDAGINTVLRKAIKEYGQLPQVDMRCGYACSDHASWTRAGYKSAFGFEVGAFSLANRAIHTANDEIKLLDMPRATKFVKFGIGLAVELAKE